MGKLLVKLFMLPSKNLTISIPIILLVGFLAGLAVNTTVLKNYILLVTVLMIYPTMIGFRLRETVNPKHKRILLISFLTNFVLIPSMAYVLGMLFLTKDPQLFAGLATAALLPTSNMTIAFTMFAGANVPAAVTLTVFSLIAGSLLAPWYLLGMVGKYVPVDIWLTMRTIGLVVFIPLIAGTLTYTLIKQKYSDEHFKKQIKPYLPAASSWGMLFIIFTSISTKSQDIIKHLDIFAIAFLVQLIFYLINYLFATLIARKFFNRADGIAFVYSTALRNLSISIGLAAMAFGSNAALMVALAFIIQGQAAALFAKLNKKYGFLTDRNLSSQNANTAI